MNRVTFLDVNRAICGGASKPRWFQLPKKKLMVNSVRFGNHAYVLDGTMQILPVGDTAPVESSPAEISWRLGARKVLNLLSDRSRYLLTFLQ
ncbi:MAG: hypothetical protein KKE37_05600 [Verrucomicrobia bacterium]|nr:hypothetical protein [Verrucomicrobiota bacterium]MBU4291231.1 hypothetical protein [Verrucomicrobiota bacterium]MBU4428813.1 hypothetical protein [Verrucomicrobiota bacterium]MCG2680958.1 hypothetical protein [Kiritimatiellia bacterium]